MYILFRTAIVASLLAFAAQAPAAIDSPVGTWRTIDDETGKAKAVVQISESDGELSGKVIKVLQSDQGPHPVCKACEGERHNQPVEGMTIVWGLERDGDEWKGGHILDPNNGKIYKAKMSLGENGETLNVRGYIGFSLLGRTQVWQHVETPAPAATIITPAAPTSVAAPVPSETPAPASASSVEPTPTGAV